jgi:hypothetical protein
MVASAFVFAVSLTGVGTIAAVADTTTPGSDLANDVQAGQTGDTTTANDVDTAEEVNVDDGQVDQVDESDNGTVGATNG